MTELTESMREFLREPRIAVLAGIEKDGMPQLTPVWFLLEGDEIVVGTARERAKGRIFEREPRGSICVVEGQRYVTISGSVTITADPDMSDVRRIGGHYEPAERIDYMVQNIFSKQQRITMHLKIEHVVSQGF